MKLKFTLYVIILLALTGILGRALYLTHTRKLENALIGTPAPNFTLPNLLPRQSTFSTQDLRNHVSLVNVWASWCQACQMEHSMLMQLAQQQSIPIYGILYKDDPKDALRWLAIHGNPYQLLGHDPRGEVSIDFGIYGTPETYVINAQGEIIHRHIGIITPQIWQQEFLPILKRSVN